MSDPKYLHPIGGPVIFGNGRDKLMSVDKVLGVMTVPMEAPAKLYYSLLPERPTSRKVRYPMKTMTGTSSNVEM